MGCLGLLEFVFGRGGVREYGSRVVVMGNRFIRKYIVRISLFFFGFFVGSRENC